MYSLAMSIKKSFAILCIILSAVDQAISLRCYKCEGANPDGDCFVNPKKKEFEVTCPIESANTFALSFPKFNLSVALPNSSAVRGRETSYASTDWDCFKMYSTGTMDLISTKAIIRWCLPKLMSDEAFKKASIEKAAENGITLSIDGLYRCDTDLCNSSGTLGVGLMSLICSLTLLFFTQL